MVRPILNYGTNAQTDTRENNWSLSRTEITKWRKKGIHWEIGKIWDTI